MAEAGSGGGGGGDPTVNEPWRFGCTSHRYVYVPSENVSPVHVTDSVAATPVDWSTPGPERW